MSKLVLAEKPAVARDLARALGVPTSGGAAGSFRGGGWVITWCIGHLVELEEPAAYEAAWRRWSLTSLPMLPERFRLRPIKSGARQFRVVRDLLRSREFVAVVNACDAGREGELIFRYCYELAGCRLPVERLWISSLTPQAIAEGLARLRPGRDYDALGDAARCRAEADWLVGMNATRAVTLWRRGGGGEGTLLSIGRVQTPTLALIVRRERAITTFIPRDYHEVRADLRAEGGAFTATWRFGAARRLGTAALAGSIAARSARAAADGQGPVVESLEERAAREPPPLLFDLTALQRTANRRFGLSAKRTLDVAQALYERHKLITYPRTDSRHLTRDLIPQLPALFAALGAEPTYAPHVAPLLAAPPAPPRRVFAPERVHDHHAIIPTPLPLSPDRTAALTREERLLLDLIARRFLGAFYPDAEFQKTRVVVRVGEGPEVPAQGLDAASILEAAPPPPDRYEARGQVRVQAGWQAVAGLGAERRPSKEGAGNHEDEDEEQALPRLSRGERLRGHFRTEALRTRPPPRYSEAALLSAMESAGRQLDSDELRAAMRDVALGTPATRAAIIETLLERGYVERSAQKLQPTPLGVDLIERLPVPSLASPELTGDWEARLVQIARGAAARAAFMADIARYVRELVAAVRAQPAPPAVPGGPPRPRPSRRGEGRPGRPPRRRPAGEGASPRARAAPATVTEGRVRKKAAPSGGAPAAATEGRVRKKAAASTSPAASAEEGARRRGAAASRATSPAAAEEGVRKKRAAASRVSAAASVSAVASAASEGRARKKSTPSSAASRAMAVGAALDPPLPCPRCGQGLLLVGRRGWGCARFREGCPLVIPFEVLGCRLQEADLRQIIEAGASRALEFRPGAGPPLRGRLRLAAGGSPAGFVYLDPL